MLSFLRTLTLMFCTVAVVTACADDKDKMEEPLHSDQVDDDPQSSDDNAGSLEDSFGGTPAPAAPTNEESFDSEAVEGAEEDGAMSEPEGAMPEAAPSEKGGIISSGVKDKKRCRLIADELERQKCLRQQAK